MVSGLKILFSKIQASPLHPAIKYPALVIVAAVLVHVSSTESLDE